LFKSILLALFMIGILSCLLVPVIYYFDPFLSMGTEPGILLINVLPLAFILGLFFSLSRRFSAAFVFTFGFLLVLFGINAKKMAYLDEPLIFLDIFLIPQMVSGWHLMGQYLSSIHVGIICLLIILLFVLFRIEKPRGPLLLNAIILVFSCSGLVYIAKGHSVPAGLYAADSGKSSPWEFSSIAQQQGLVASLTVGARLTQFKKPVIDHAALDEYRGLMPELMAARQVSISPDIVLWLSESFFDPDVIDGYDICKVWRLWCELKEQQLHSEISVHTFGGNTTRTEFEVLTGVPFPLLNGHDYPYISAVTSPMASVPWQLKISGYKTIAIHAHNRSFWLRHRAFPLLGFDEYYGEEDDIFQDAQREGFFISDAFINNLVIDTLDSADEPQFIFAISMENHGPWDVRPGLKKERLAPLNVPESLSKKSAVELRHYLYHGQNAINELQRLKDYIDARERPTLIVFFGDHLPGMNDVFDQIKFVNGGNSRAQKLPVLALSNYELSNDWFPQAAHELGVWTLALAGQLGDSHFAELNLALKHSKSDIENIDGLLHEALRAMQVRQLHISPSSL